MERADEPHFGTLLRRFRIDAGLTQQDLAERANVSVEAISTLERGARTRPHKDTVSSLARALKLTPEHETLLEEAVGAVRRPPINATVLRLVVPDTKVDTPNNLPRQLTTFVGREDECAKIRALLDEHHLVTVVGAGGVGKTRVALHMAGTTLDRYADGVWFVDFAPRSDPALLAEAVLSALRLPPSKEPAIDGIVAYLKGRRCLLIFDNCEHLIGSVADMGRRIAQSCVSVRILATSREALHVAGEQLYRLPSLPVPAAVQLFADRAHAVDSGFALAESNATAVAEVCRRLDGIALAIELAAARISVLAPGQIAARLDQRFRLLTDGSNRALPRHRTMTALLDWSYELLNAREQRFFDAFSVFAGGCTLEIVTAVCADEGEDDLATLDLIASLVAKSLLIAELSGDAQRYRFLESTRQYAAMKLIGRGLYEVYAERHARAFLELAKSVEAGLDLMSDEELRLRADAERDNWRAALDRTLVKKLDVVLGQRLAAVRAPFAGASAEGRHWVRKALELVDARSPRALIADLELADAYYAGVFTERRLCLAAAQRALALYREAGDALGIAQSQYLAAGSLILLGEAAAGEALLHEAMETARRLRKRRLSYRILLKLNFAREEVGDFTAARIYATEAIEIGKAIGGDLLAAYATGYLASTEAAAGRFDAALQLFGDAVAAYRAFPSPEVAGMVNQMVVYLVILGRYDEARAHAAEALRLAQSFGYSAEIVLALQSLAVVAVLAPRVAQPAITSLSAKLYGFAERRMAALGLSKDYGSRKHYDRALDVLRGALGSDECSRLTTVGAAMTEDEAIEAAHALT